MKKISKTGLMMFLVSLAGCGLMPPEPKRMYDGNPLPMDQVAVISEGARAFLAVIAVDGAYVVNPALGGAPFTKGLLVKPGIHKIDVRYFNVDSFGATVDTASASAQLELQVEAGHSYVLRGERGSEKYNFWFVDKGVGYNLECLTVQNYTKMYFSGENVPGC